MIRSHSKRFRIVSPKIDYPVIPAIQSIGPISPKDMKITKRKDLPIFQSVDFQRVIPLVLSPNLSPKELRMRQSIRTMKNASAT